MNNKKIGTLFEQRVVKYLADHGYWVHFITPDSRGAQPFDIIAVRNGEAIAIDCKTSVSKNFTIMRLEDNQIMAFKKWLSCGNSEPIIAVEYQDEIICIEFSYLMEHKKVDLSAVKEIQA